MYATVLAIAGLIAGAIASIAGFGIGSILTPLLAFGYGTKLAVAAVSIPHVLGTLLRFWLIRSHVNRPVLLSFGVASAAGGLAGALLHTVLVSPALSIILGILLAFAGVSAVTGFSQRMWFGGRVGWAAGTISGLLGGLVGNQGGIRSAALIPFDLSRDAFVATATAIALIVDAARVPVYLGFQAHSIARIWHLVGVMALGVLVGTVTGKRVLSRIPEPVFRRAVGVVIFALGVALLGGVGR
jgi:uncharacterized membrane protein YfcA